MHARLARRRAVQYAGLKVLAQPQEFRRRLREVDIDRIELLDGGEALGTADERALGNHGASDAAADRSLDRGIFEIEPCRRQAGLRERDVGIGLRERRHRIILLLRADDVALAQFFLAIGLLARLNLDCLRPLQSRLGTLDLNAEQGRIDPVEHVALSCEAALFENPFDHDAGYARPNLGDAGGRTLPGSSLTTGSSSGTTSTTLTSGGGVAGAVGAPASELSQAETSKRNAKAAAILVASARAFMGRHPGLGFGRKRR